MRLSDTTERTVEGRSDNLREILLLEEELSLAVSDAEAKARDIIRRGNLAADRIRTDTESEIDKFRKSKEEELSSLVIELKRSSNEKIMKITSRLEERFSKIKDGIVSKYSERILK